MHVHTCILVLVNNSKKVSRDVFELPVNSSSSVSSTPARPQKCKRQPELWKKKHSQVKASTGKMVASAKPGPPSKCKKECYTKFTDYERKKIFSLCKCKKKKLNQMMKEVI